MRSAFAKENLAPAGAHFHAVSEASAWSPAPSNGALGLPFDVNLARCGNGPYQAAESEQRMDSKEDAECANCEEHYADGFHGFEPICFGPARNRGRAQL